MFIKVKEIKKYEKGGQKAAYETLINTDNIDYIRYDDHDGVIQFNAGNYVLVTAESSYKVVKALYGEEFK